MSVLHASCDQNQIKDTHELAKGLITLPSRSNGPCTFPHAIFAHKLTNHYYHLQQNLSIMNTSTFENV